LHLWFTFRGNIQQKPFIGMILVLLLMSSLGMFLINTADTGYKFEGMPQGQAQMITLLGLALLILAQVSALSLVVRRLRDIG